MVDKSTYALRAPVDLSTLRGCGLMEGIMIESFEKKEAVSPHTITSTGCRAIVSNCNDYQARIPAIDQIVRIEVKDSEGNVILSVDGGNVTISVEREQLGYHYL